WTVGLVTPGVPRTLALQARYDAPFVLTNGAFISHADQHDPDPTNNGGTAAVAPPPVGAPPPADLTVLKTADNPTPSLGDTITFIVTLTNKGPGAATNVSVTDLFPQGLALLAATPSQGRYESSVGLWALGTVPPGAATTLTLTARVLVPYAQTN